MKESGNKEGMKKEATWKVYTINHNTHQDRTKPIRLREKKVEENYT